MSDDDDDRSIMEIIAEAMDKHEAMDKLFTEDDVRMYKRRTTPSWAFGWHPLPPSIAYDIPVGLVGYWKRRDGILFEIRQGVQIHPGKPKFVWFAFADTAFLLNPKADCGPPNYFAIEVDARDACDAVDTTQVDRFLLYPRSGELRCGDDDNA